MSREVVDVSELIEYVAGAEDEVEIVLASAPHITLPGDQAAAMLEALLPTMLDLVRRGVSVRIYTRRPEIAEIVLDVSSASPTGRIPTRASSLVASGAITSALTGSLIPFAVLAGAAAVYAVAAAADADAAAKIEVIEVDDVSPVVTVDGQSAVYRVEGNRVRLVTPAEIASGAVGAEA